MEENDKEKKETNESQNDIQFYQVQIKGLNNKLTVLIKGIKEEREKSKNLTQELETLKLEKILKDETISKLKRENESLNSILSKNDPKSYFDNITKLNTTINFNPEEYNAIKEENAKLKEENKFLIEQNTELINKVEKITEEKNFINEQLLKIKNEQNEQIKILNEKEQKINILSNILNGMEMQKNSKENEIEKYKLDELNSKNELKKVKDDLEGVKKENEKYKLEILELNKQMDNLMNIDINKYIFKGVVIEDSFNDKKLYNKIVSIKFDNKDIYIEFNIGNNMRYIDAKKMEFRKYEQSDEVIIITYPSDDEEDNDNVDKKVILCKFKEREIKYLFNFKLEIMKKYKENLKLKEDEDNKMINAFIFD